MTPRPALSVPLGVSVAVLWCVRWAALICRFGKCRVMARIGRIVF
jgi:hypothetical protein